MNEISLRKKNYHYLLTRRKFSHKERKREREMKEEKER